jgi:hypothetical protein
MNQHVITILAYTAMEGSYHMPYHPSAHGIPWHPAPNQRKRRKQHRQTRPHGWKGGAE